MTHTISEAAHRAGVSADTVRYYERLGLLPPAERLANGYRRYDIGVVTRIRFIKGAQRSGLRLNDIKELLDISDRGACPCGHTRALLEQRISDVDDELNQLQILRRDLVDLLTGLDTCGERPAGTWWCETAFIAKGGDHR